MRRLILLLALSVAACQSSGGRHVTTRDREQLVLGREREWKETETKWPAILGVEGLSRNSSENIYFAEQARRQSR
jgi:hypothetical protein